ncbi:MAG: PTS transporter subunit EIIA [Gemmatimonadetes bacterium]|nr:PTS transporter subunit EIIA [Gemmatimonadota bacterium]MBT5142051.1 PTS transporter subunit EIIA [Gemmatimonadota bacterium]MBT5590168.1 PTS transporter subunit EIIA [Gemmatimonadota bacterium]MBT5961032.1 PTS transporter subunit EIIA [Gemmatimonadota bacterium]MBT6628723.1 PTS transporter subunit EIIA [Gemmatimonadota bacterium]
MPRSAVRILVAIENPAAEDSLVRLAASLASEPWGELHLTHVVTPDEPALPDAQKQLERAAQIAVDLGVGAIPHIVHGPSVTQVIGEALERWNCDILLMGWYGAVDRDSVLSSNNRALTKALDVDTLIFKDKGFNGARRIMVPTGGGPHSLMGIEVANRISAAWNVDMQVLRVARDPACREGDPLLERYCQQVSEDLRLQLRLLDLNPPFEVVPAQDVVTPIIERARVDDLVVVGAANDWREEGFLAGSIPDEIAYRSPCSVLTVRSRAPSTYRLSSIFWEHTIRLDLHPRDKWEAIDQMVDILVEEKQVPSSQKDNVLEAARSRESKSSTSIGRETAIPHAPMPDLPGIIGALGICPEGVDFNGVSGDVVRYIFLLLTPQQNYRSYIPVLGQIAQMMHTDETRSAFLHCQTPSELTALIKKREAAAA